MIDAVVCGSYTVGASYAPNPDSFPDVEDHAYCTGCIVCSGVEGDVTSPVRESHVLSSLDTEVHTE